VWGVRGIGFGRCEYPKVNIWHGELLWGGGAKILLMSLFPGCLFGKERLKRDFCFEECSSHEVMWLQQGLILKLDITVAEQGKGKKQKVILKF